MQRRCVGRKGSLGLVTTGCHAGQVLFVYGSVCEHHQEWLAAAAYLLMQC